MAKPIDIEITASKIVYGAVLHKNDFTFELKDEHGKTESTAKNDDFGWVRFKELTFNKEGVFKFSIRETHAPKDCDISHKIVPLEIHVTEAGPGRVEADVIYPEGPPVFTNDCGECNNIVFEALKFDQAGTFEFTVKELSKSGGGWITDSREYRVKIIVKDDGHGNLIAVVEYPEGFPKFVDIFEHRSIEIVLKACKIASGAKLPKGKFKFGVFDEHGKLVATAYNE